MREKSSLVLMELLIMILVFALAAALCLQVFAKADAIANRTVRLEEAALLARNAAEMLKATRGDLEKVRSLPSGDYSLEIREIPAETRGLGQAEIRVYDGEALLVCFDAGWQEVLP